MATAVARLRGNQLHGLAPPQPRRKAVGALDVAREMARDWLQRIDTRGRASAEQFGFSAAAVWAYVPTPWRVIDLALDAVAPGPNDVLVDFGCGKGRVLVAARRYPFKSIVGVEIVPELAASARLNVRGDPRCKIHVCDARLFEIPDDVTVVYLFNPFSPATQELIGSRLMQSLSLRPRQLRIAAYHTTCEWLPPLAVARQLAAHLTLYVLNTDTG